MAEGDAPQSLYEVSDTSFHGTLAVSQRNVCKEHLSRHLLCYSFQHNGVYVYHTGVSKMRVTLSFDLPEEKTELFNALQGFDWEMVVGELARQLRQWRKYEGKESVKIEELEQFLHEELSERNLGGLGDLW